MVVRNVDVEAMMDEEDKKASERPTGQFVPTFLRLKDKQRARVRPLCTVNQMVVMPMHSDYDKMTKKYLNAVCSSEIDKPCPYCAAAKDNKKLAATTTFMLPVFVSSLEEKKKNEAGKEIWMPVTYKDSDDNDQFVSGLRIIELKRFGTINDVFQSVRSLNQEDEKHDIRQYGLIIERIGGDQKTIYTTLPKGPSPMPDNAKAAIPTREAVYEMVMAACPPAGAAPTETAEPDATTTKDQDLEF